MREGRALVDDYVRTVMLNVISGAAAVSTTAPVGLFRRSWTSIEEPHSTVLALLLKEEGYCAVP